MLLRFFLLMFIFLSVSFSVLSDGDVLHNSRTFISQRYDIYIYDDKCTMPVDCENITAIIVDKKDNKKLTATGMTITTGVGRNLRGYELSSGKYKFILRQPEAESDKDINFDQWTLLVEVENERGHFILFFRDTGEITW
ncbi:hypothetical protein [Erwinia mallotivora]|nr:hypothetical protein [Erwinia mallotivora]